MESQFMTLLEMIEITSPIEQVIKNLGFESETIMFSPDQHFAHPEAIKRGSTIYSNSLRKDDSVITYDIEITKKKLNQEASAFYKMGLKIEKDNKYSASGKTAIAHMIEGRTVQFRNLDDSVKAVFEKAMQPRLYEVLNHKL